jgi:uncharacterized protein
MGTLFDSAYNRILATLALAALVAALAAYAYYTLRQAEYLYMGPPTISVIGEGEVTAIPDVGQFTFTVVATAPKAEDAQRQVAEKINAITTYLEKEEIADADIKTEQYSFNPKYRFEEQPCLIGRPCVPGRQVEDGFEASQSIAVKVRDLAKAGALISEVGTLGATNLSGLIFTVDDEDALKAEAREQAILHAKKQSEELAKQLGVRIVRMTGYYEEGPMMPMPYYGGDMMAKSAVPMAESATPDLPPGEQSTKSRVTLTFQVE